MKRILISTLTVITCLSACKKNNNGEGPSVTITSPANDASFNLVDTVDINAIISHDIEMHTYKVTVINEETGNRTVLKDEHMHEENINVEVPFYLNESSHTHYYIIVEAEDHDGNTGSDTIYIHSDN